MAMRFDQIGSQQNVQNVGEGEAYVYEKQKSPLLALGEQAMKTKLAEDKAKAKALAGGAAKIDLLKVESPTLAYTIPFNKALNQIATTVNKKGDPNAVNAANTKVQQASNLAVASKQYTTDFNKTDDLATNLFKTGDASSRVYNKKASEIKSTANKLTESNPDDYLQGISESLGYLSQNNPNDVLNSAMKHSDANIDKMATGIASNLKTYEAGLSTSGGLTREKLRNIKDKAIGDINVLVDKEGKSTATINTYMDKFYENANAELNNPKNSAFLSTKQTEGSELVGKNDKGEDIYIDPKEYSKAKFKEDLMSKIDRSDVLTTKIVKDYGTKSFNFGVAGNPNSKYVVDDGGEVSISSTVFDRKGATGVNVETYLPFTVSYADQTGGGKLPTINFANQYITDHSAGGDNKLPHRSVSRGNIEIQTLSPGITFNGKTSPVLQLPKDTPASVDAYYKLIKKQVDLGVFNKDTDLKVDVIGFGKMIKNAKDDSDYNGNPDDALKELKANRLKKSTTLSSLVLNKTSLNALNASSNRIVSKNDFVNTDNAKMQQEAIDKIKKEYGWSTKTTGGSGGGSGATTNTGAMSSFNVAQPTDKKKTKDVMGVFGNSGAAKGSFNDKYKGNHMTYVDVAKTHTGSLDDLIPKLADWEDKNKGGKGGGDYWGINDAKYDTKEKAIAHYKEKYLPQVSNLPKGVQALGLQQVINTGDAWGPAMTAAGLYSEKGEGGKLGIRGDNRREGKVEKISIRQRDLYNKNIKAITDSYNKDPKAFRERYLKAMKYHYDNAF